MAKKLTLLEKANDKIARLEKANTKLKKENVDWESKSIVYSNALYKSDKQLAEMKQVCAEQLMDVNKAEKALDNKELANAKLREDNLRLNGMITMADRNTNTLLNKMLDIETELTIANANIPVNTEDGE